MHCSLDEHWHGCSAAAEAVVQQRLLRSMQRL